MFVLLLGSSAKAWLEPGIFYPASCLFGQQFCLPFPSLSQVRASSPACRSTDPKALVGAGFARCNFAGPRMEDGQLSRWAGCGTMINTGMHPLP